MSRRNCPECQSSMLVTNYSGVEIDECAHCGGVFLDFMEISHVVKNPKQQKFFENIQKGDFTRDNVGKEISCCECGVHMEEREYIYGSGNHINFCKICGSVYLDAHEIEQLQNYEMSRRNSKEGMKLYAHAEKQGQHANISQEMKLDAVKSRNSFVKILFGEE